jgi:hypothetical protein
LQHEGDQYGYDEEARPENVSTDCRKSIHA